uniref:Uncharacterized protein n=1 Tax=Photinus pyralis TaxID=7054 RepID=A0A1Y1MIG5_PHOPY
MSKKLSYGWNQKSIFSNKLKTLSVLVRMFAMMAHPKMRAQIKHGIKFSKGVFYFHIEKPNFNRKPEFCSHHLPSRCTNFAKIRKATPERSSFFYAEEKMKEEILGQSSGNVFGSSVNLEKTLIVYLLGANLCIYLYLPSPT